MLRAASQRIPAWLLSGGALPRWGWLLLLLGFLLGVVSVILSLSIGRIEGRADEIDRDIERTGRWAFGQLMEIQKTLRHVSDRVRAAQLGLGEPMTVREVKLQPGKTFEWQALQGHVTFTIIEVRDKTVRIKIDGHTNAPDGRRMAPTRFKTVDATLSLEPGTAMSLRPAVDIIGLPDLHVVLLEPPQRAWARIAVGPKAQQPSWGRLGRD